MPRQLETLIITRSTADESNKIKIGQILTCREAREEREGGNTTAPNRANRFFLRVLRVVLISSLS